MPKTNLQVRVDSGLKAEAEQLFIDIGLDIASAVRLFLAQSLIKNGLPFTVERDPLRYAKKLNTRSNSINRLDKDNVVPSVMDDLEDTPR